MQNKRILITIMHLLIIISASIAGYSLLILVAEFNQDGSPFKIPTEYPCMEYYNDLTNWGYLIFKFIYFAAPIYFILGLYRIFKNIELKPHHIYEILIILTLLMFTIGYFIYNFIAPFTFESSWSC